MRGALVGKGGKVGYAHVEELLDADEVGDLLVQGVHVAQGAREDGGAGVYGDKRCRI